MSDRAAIATAWIRLVPSMDGATEAIAEAISPGITAAAKEANKGGASVGGQFVDGVKKAITGAAIIGAATFLVKGLYDLGATFDDVYDTIRIGTGATGDALEDLYATAKDVGRNIPAEWSKIGPTVADVNTRLGVTGGTLKTISSQYLEAGRILGQDVDIQSTTAAFNAFRLEGDEVSGALDHLFRVSQATGIGMNQLASTVKTAAPLVKNVGFTFEETTSLVGQLDKAGLDANKMLAALAPGLVNMARSGEQPAEVFPRIISELQDLIDKGDDAAAIDLAGGIFGTRGAANFVAAIQSGVVNLQDLVSVAGMSDDTILGVAEETADFAETWLVLQNNAQAALEPLASTVFSFLGDTLSGLMPYLTGFSDWLSENEWMVGVFATAIGVLLVGAFVAWTATIWAANAALLANPITWIVLAVIALIAAIVLLVMNWDDVVAWVTDVWNGFVDWLVGSLLGLANWWNDIWTGIGDFFTGLWQGYVEWVGNTFVRPLMTVVGAISSWWSDLWNGVGQTFESVWNGIVSFFRGIANGLLGMIEGFVNGAIGIVNGLTGGINAVSGLIGIPAIPAIPTVALPRLAEGAVVMPTDGGTLAMIAEAGRPEVVLPLDRLYDFIPEPRDEGPPMVYNAAPNQSFDAEEDLWVALERKKAA